MKRFLWIVCWLPMTLAASEPFWGATGHRVVGEVAARHLSRKARKAVERLLEGQSLAEASTFGDDIKSDPRYRRFTVWHYVNIPADQRYPETAHDPDGDLVAGIEHCLSVLKDPDAPREEQAFYLKLLIHFIGDLHQPLHVGRAEDKGGNDLQLQWFNQGSNLHRVWDTNLIESYGMSYTELAGNLPHWSKAQVRQIQGGSLLEWVDENQDLANRVYASVETGEKLSYPYRYQWWDVVEQQLLLAGLRLAAVLNDLYG